MEREYWSGADITFWCLVDKKRTLKLEKAIKETIKKGDVVVDAGTGTGILAMLAIKYGAQKVFAIESDKNLWRFTLNNIKKNKYLNKIKLIKGDIRKVTLPEKVDIIICEMVSTGLIDETQIPAMNHLLKYLDKEGKVIIYKIQNLVDLVYNKNNFYGHKVETVRYEYCWHPELKSLTFTKKKIYKDVDFTKRNSSKVDVNIILKILRDGTINGIRLSNKTILSNGDYLGDTESYCMPLILPIEAKKVKKGDFFLVNLSYKLCGGLKNLKYKIKKVEK